MWQKANHKRGSKGEGVNEEKNRTKQIQTADAMQMEALMSCRDADSWFPFLADSFLARRLRPKSRMLPAKPALCLCLKTSAQTWLSYGIPERKTLTSFSSKSSSRVKIAKRTSSFATLCKLSVLLARPCDFVPRSLPAGESRVPDSDCGAARDEGFIEAGRPTVHAEAKSLQAHLSSFGIVEALSVLQGLYASQVFS